MHSPIKLGQPLDDVDLGTAAVSIDGPPPAKKRKTMAPKERTTEHVDLMKPFDEFTAEDKRQMDRLVEALRKKKKIVVIAGAGISVSAGIPDFRSSTGLFATVKSQHKLKASGKQLFDASVYRHDASTESFHTMVRNMDTMSKAASPTPFHHLLASLAQEKRLLRLYSQNIDCLDTSMKPLATNVPLNVKGPWPATVQLHGSLEKMVCTKCGSISAFESDIFNGPEAPLCKTCVETDQVRTAHAGKRSHGIGRLRPRFVLYNEYNPDEEAIGTVSSADLKARPDAVIVVGTTLKVPGTRRLVKELCQVTRGRRDGFTAWINIDSAPKGVEFKDCWDLVVRSKCDDVAREVALPPWDCNIGNDYLVSAEEDAENKVRRSNSVLEVNIPSDLPETAQETVLSTPKSKQVGDIQGILTPRPSPKITAVKQPGKAKQTKLAFGNTAEGKQTKPKAPKTGKPRGRKPKHLELVTTKNTVTETFKTAKNVDGVPAGKKLEKDLVSTTTQPPGKNTEPITVSLQPGIEGSEKEIVWKQEVVVSEKIDTTTIQPTTPTKASFPTKADTISPKSAPRGMTGLIDMGSN